MHLHPMNASPSYDFGLNWPAALHLDVFFTIFGGFNPLLKNLAGNRDEHKHVFFKTAH